MTRKATMTPVERAIARGYLASEFRCFWDTPALEAEFVRLGRTGANGDVGHPNRIRWEAARIVLQDRGAIRDSAEDDKS